MRIFVTGGTGFIGSHFLSVALDAGHAVRALRRPGAHPRMPLAAEPEWVDGTLDVVPTAALVGCDAVVHLAAVGVDGKASWENSFTVNVQQSLRFWLQAVEAGVRRFVVCGSCFEYGRAGERYEFIPVTAPLEPTAPYHASKAAATMAAMGLAVDRRLQMTILRPFHVYGEGEDANRLWPALRAAALAGRDFSMTLGGQVRDFVEVGEVARRFLVAAEIGGEPGLPRIEHVGSGTPQTLLNFAEHWWRHWGASGRLLPGTVPYRPNEVMRYVPASQPAASVLS